MRCPNCGGETDANLLFCRHCGERIDLIQQNGQMPNGQPGGESSPYSRGGGNNYNPYSGHGNGGRSPGDILMIAIGTVLALAAVGIAVFIMTHMVGDGDTVKKKDSSVSVESEKAESKESGKTVVPTSEGASAKPTETPTETPSPEPTATPEEPPTATPIPQLAASYSCGSTPGVIASLFKVTITDGEASSELHQKEGNYDNSPQMMYDGDSVTSWQHGTEGNGTGQQLRFTFNTASIRAICFKLGNWRTADLYRQNSRPSRMQLTLGGETVDVSFTDSMQNHYIVFNRPVLAADILITITAAYDGIDFNDCCISEMELFAE